MAAKIMIIGYGSTGKYVLDMATKLNYLADCRFTVVSRTPPEEAIKRINITRVSSGIFDFYPAIDYRYGDINDIESISGIIAEVSPDIIAYTGRYMKGFKYGEFSYPNGIGYGAWTPMAVVLVYKLMQAVKQSGVKTRVINTSYGDAVSPALASVGLAPYTSAGNLNHLIPRIKRAYAQLSGDDTDKIDVTFAGSHYVNTYISKEGTPKGSPYLMKVSSPGGADIQDDLIFKRCAEPTISGPERNWMIASDVVMLMRLMTDNSNTAYNIHAPGPMGLIGGYPLLFCGAEMRLDESVFSRSEMETVNKASMACDGVECIDENGITFTDETINKMKIVFNMTYPKTIAIEDCERFSIEIAATLSKYAKER